YLKEFSRPAVSVYYRRDYVVGFPYWRKHGLRTEQELAASADVVLANSSLFGRQLEAFNSNVHVINTGVDLELYNAGQQRPRPVDLTTISFPIIGFTGALLASRLDLKLLEALLERLPAFNFVFVGPQDNAFAQSALHGHRNAFFLGKKEPEELPTYIQYFDVCINPQVMNPITDGNYPLKIDEYLAMGKPVVATSTHTMRDVFGAHTHLATGVAEYVDAIGQAVTECNDPMLKQARIDFAHTHSWGHSVAKIYKAIEAYEGNSN
ncbi:MAG: glycosyltransferase, partial [Prevotellaceae bacterium]|nr:glycosyltransferase [Prevotellaceae bacterium]